MHVEMKRIKFLFATFVLAYILRSFYQIFLSLSLYRKLISSLVCRWYLIDMLPLIWEIPSILSILILHYISFQSANAMPAAGHFKKKSKMPDLETSSNFSSEDDRTTLLHLQPVLTDTASSPTLSASSGR